MPKSSSAEKLTPEALKQLVNKKWGADTMRFASDPSLSITRVPCGILSIDYVLGGGFPRGRHIEIFGSYSVGKTYCTQRLIASAQSLGLNCAFVDVENTFDPAFAETIGIDLEALAFHKQEHGNRVIDFIETLLRSELYDVIALDSIAALLPKAELDSDMEGGSYGTAQAKLMSAALRRLTAANKKTVLVYINQTRDSLGSIFQKRAVTSGGKAMGFYAGIRLEMVRVENIKRKAKVIDPAKGDEQQKDIVKGHRVLVKIDKSKIGGARPQDTTTFVFDYDIGGIDPVEDLLYLGRRLGFIRKSGTSWWVEDYEDEKKVGRNAFKKWLRAHPSIQEELTELIQETDPPLLDEED